MVDDRPDIDESNARDDEYPIAPPAFERPKARMPWAPFSFDPDQLPQFGAPKDAPFQFSLADLLLLVAAVSIVLGLTNWLPPAYAAGLAGFGALVSMVVLASLKPSRAIVYVGWWVVLAIYLVSCFRAMITGR
jgi:hypothetical protein